MRLPRQHKRIAGVPRDHVDVKVKHRLPCRGAAGLQDVHAVAAQALHKPRRHPLSGLVQARETGGVDLVDIGRMLTWNHEEMAPVGGGDVQKHHAVLVLIYDRGGYLAPRQLAEQTFRIAWHKQSVFVEVAFDAI